MPLEAQIRGLLVALSAGVTEHRCSPAAPEDSPGAPYTTENLHGWMFANKDTLWRDV